MAKLDVQVGDTIRTLLPMRVYRYWLSDDLRCAVDLIFRDCSFMYYVPDPITGGYSGLYGNPATDPRAVYFVDGDYTLDPTTDNIWAAKYPAITTTGTYTYKIIHEPMTYYINQGEFTNFYADFDAWLAANPPPCYGQGNFTVEAVSVTLPVYDELTGTWVPVSFPYTVFENGTVDCPIVEVPAGVEGTIGWIDSAVGCDGKLWGTVDWDTPLLNHQPHLIELEDTVTIAYQAEPQQQTFDSEYLADGTFTGDAQSVDYTPVAQFNEIDLLVYEKVVV